MNRLYVRFAGDNDFIITVDAFVKAIAPRIFLLDWNITKEDIVNLFNQTAYSLYLLHQSELNKPSLSVQSYLKIETKDVYFDKEIDEFTNYNSDGCLAVVEHDSIEYYVM